MTGFDATWLALRETHDAKARNRRVLASLRRWCAQQSELAVVDLATGTGANVRCLAPLLDVPQSWTLLEQDPALCALALTSLDAAQAVVKQLDLAAPGALDHLATANLVTGSAFLDLVSEAWLDRLITRTTEAGQALYIALTVDGRVNLEPLDDDDELVFSLFAAHQRLDKGFGPALGPAATDSAVQKLRERGYRVITGRSDWGLGMKDAALLKALLGFWVAAARKQATADQHHRIEAWSARRVEALTAGRLRAWVGHRDFFACP